MFNFVLCFRAVSLSNMFKIYYSLYIFQIENFMLPHTLYQCSGVSLPLWSRLPNPDPHLSSYWHWQVRRILMLLVLLSSCLISTSFLFFSYKVLIKQWPSWRPGIFYISVNWRHGCCAKPSKSKMLHSLIEDELLNTFFIFQRTVAFCPLKVNTRVSSVNVHIQ